MIKQRLEELYLKSSIKFDYICDIIPETDTNGHMIEYQPQSRYNNKRYLSLDKYGHGSFCRFRVPKGYRNDEGVYIIFYDERLVYIGECVDLGQRFNYGYGQISPKNCFKGGQPTNCRINKLIFKASLDKAKISLFFSKTNNRKEIEKTLIQDFRPQWNKKN